MDVRAVDNSLSSFDESIRYFIELIELQKKKIENQTEIFCEYQQFLTNLESLQQSVIDEYRQAVTIKDAAAQKYIANFIKKLATLKNVIATSNSHVELDNALSDVMIAAETPIGVHEKIACVLASIVGAIVGAIIGAIEGFVVGAVLGLVALPITLPIAFLDFATIPALILGPAVLGAMGGAVAGAVESPIKFYEDVRKDMKARHSTKIEDATHALFKDHKDLPGHHCNSHLFFHRKSSKPEYIPEMGQQALQPNPA